MASVLSAKHFHDEAAAYAWVEARVWPDGPICPKCGAFKRVGKMGGKSTRIGAYKCYVCRKPFTVKVGTVFEASHVPMTLWLQAMFLMTSSKKGVSSNQLHRTLGVTLKTAWFMSHRIRLAMQAVGLPPMGGDGAVVEIDETVVGRQEDGPKPRGGSHGRNIVLTLVQRGGSSRSFHVEGSTIGTLIPIIRANVAHDTRVMTDQAGWYKNLNKTGYFTSHESVDHSKEEWARGPVTTNTVEGYFSVFKRGMRGIYQHCGERHLHRYLAEFDFRYSNRSALGVNDGERAERALLGIVGKRLTYQTTIN